MATTTSQQGRQDLDNGVLGGQEERLAEPAVGKSVAPNRGAPVNKGRSGGTRKSVEAKGRRSPTTNRADPATKQLVEWVDTVGVKRAAEVLGEAPSTVKRWGVTHTPNAEHVAAFTALAIQQGAEAADPMHSGKGQRLRVDVPQTAAQVEDDGDIEYIDNRPIEEGDAPINLSDIPKAEQVEKFQHKPQRPASSIKVNLVRRGGETEVAPVTVNPFAPKPQTAAVAVKTPRPQTQAQTVNQKKMMSEAEYNQLMSQIQRGTPLPPPTPQGQPRQIVVSEQIDEPEPLPTPPPVVAKRKPVTAIDSRLPVASDFTVEEAIDLLQQMGTRLGEVHMAQLRDIFFPWNGKGVFLSFPVIKDTNPGTAWAIAQIFRDLGDKGGGDIVMGNSNIDHARNILADKFLKSESQWMFFLDDDVVPPTGRAAWFKYVANTPKNYPDELAGVHVIHQLLSHGKTLVGGIYYGRQARGAPLYHEGLTTHEGRAAVKDLNRRELVATEWFATGCMMIHRTVFEDIKIRFPELKVDHETFEWDFFQKVPGSGEDASFCKRAKASGHQPYIDLKVRCAHVGYCAWGSWNTNPEPKV